MLSVEPQALDATHSRATLKGMARTRYRFTHPVSVLSRPGGALQVGLDAERGLLLADAPPCADAALRAFRTARTPLEVAHLVPGVDEQWLAGAIALLRRHGLLVAHPDAPVAAVRVVGAGVLADAVAAAVGGEHRLVDADRRDEPPARGVLTVVCPGTVEPDRVRLRELVDAGATHLVARAEPERAVVGPFVTRGSACVACTDLVRRDLDRDWPHLLAQLCRAAHTPTRAQAAWVASLVTAQASAWAAGRTPEASGATLELDVAGTLGARSWPRHPDCACVLAAAA